MKLYGGIDLHCNNSYLGIIDKKDKRVFQKKLPNDLETVLKVLKPYRKDMEGIAVESTFNWYWLVDGLIEEGYTVHLANPSAIKQYEGLKHSDDIRDAFHLAHLLKLGILPEGYIYPKKERPVRDLLRKRLFLMKHKTSHILSFKNMVSRSLGIQISSNEVKRLFEEDVEKLFQQEHLILAGKAHIATIRFLKEKITGIEKAILKKAVLRDEYSNLLTVPGVGKILALTIMLETGDISEIPGSRQLCFLLPLCQKQLDIKREKQRGRQQQKRQQVPVMGICRGCQLCVRSYPFVRMYYQKKTARTNSIVAIKAVSHKLARASYYVIKNQEVFQPKKAFG